MEPSKVKNQRLIFKSRTVRSPKHTAVVRETACMVMEDDMPIAVAEVRQHVVDCDCKFIGQKRALEKMLKKYAPGEAHKETRRELWHKFLMRSAHGRKLIGAVNETKVQN